MFKGVKAAVDKFFRFSFFKRVAVLALILATLAIVGDVIFNDVTDMYFSPNEEVYTHLHQLATDIVRTKSTDFLENSDILKSYQITENSEDQTITIKLCGRLLEEVKLVVTTDYTLLAITNRHRDDASVMSLFITLHIGLYLFYSALVSLLFNLFLKGLKYVYERHFNKYWNKVVDFFNNLMNSFDSKVNSIFPSPYTDEVIDEFNDEVLDE